MRLNTDRPAVPLTLIIQRQQQQRERDLEGDWARPRPELPLPQDYRRDEQWIYPPTPAESE